MTSGQMLMAFTLGTAALALWSYLRWPGAAPATIKGAVIRVALALLLLQVGAAALGLRRRGRAARRRRSRSRGRHPGTDVRVPRLDLVPEGLRRADPRRRRVASSIRPTRRSPSEWLSFAPFDVTYC